MGVGSELGGAATTMWRRRQRIEKHGGRTAERCSGSGVEGCWLWSGRGGRGCRWRAERCSGPGAEAAAW